MHRIALFAASLPALLLSGGTALAFDGCLAGTVNSTPNPDLTAVTTFFDNFVVPAGDVGTCDLAVDTGAPHDADVFIVYSADYRGQMTLADGETGTLSVTHNGMIDVESFAGPIDIFGGPLTFHYVASTPDGLITSFIELDMLDASDGFSGAALDTIDYAQAATTTLADQQASIDQLAAQRIGIVTHLSATADLAGGALQRLEGPNRVTLLAGVGSHMLGATGHMNLSDGFSIHGGAAVFGLDAGGASASGALLTASLRYVMPGEDMVRPFAEAGARVAPRMALSFGRSYDDGNPGGASPTSEAVGDFFGAYVRGGVLVRPDPSNEIVFSGTLAHHWLRTDAYAETMSADNLFAASFPAQTGSFTTAKLGVDWTRMITPDVDVTLSAALGHNTAHDGFESDVAFVGSLTGAPQSEFFAEVGGRVGWNVSDPINVGIFAFATAGAASGTHVLVGGDVNVEF